MRFALWISKAADTPSEYIILIAFPQQQWLQERVSVLRYTYTACVVGWANTVEVLPLAEFCAYCEELGDVIRKLAAP